MKVNKDQVVEQKVEAPVSELDKMIPTWKAQWGKLFKSVIDGETYIWRKLRRKEYVELMAERAGTGEESHKLYERQDNIAKLVVLYPENIEELIESNAGLATTIADEVILKSGFDIASTEEI